MNSFAAVILAAGRSSRMKRPKLLLPWENTTILGHHVRQWRLLGAEQIGVVICDKNEAVRAELEKPEYGDVSVIVNPLPFAEMFDSILCASSWTGWSRDITRWAVMLGDQPQIKRSTLADLLLFSERHSNKICQPAHEGKPHHPVIFPMWAWPQLRLMPRYHSLKEFLLEHEPACAQLECGAPELTLDIDYPADYLRAVALNSTRSTHHA